jgi:hypothetical protein
MSAAAIASTIEPPLLADAKAAPRPTPQATIDAVMWTVRERGLRVLTEPANQQRLLNCDAAARSQINQRIEKLIAVGRVPGEVKING